MAAAEERDESKYEEFCHICATVAIGLKLLLKSVFFY